MVWHTNVRKVPAIATLQALCITKVDGLVRKERILKKKSSVHSTRQKTSPGSVACRYDNSPILVDQKCPAALATGMPLGARYSFNDPHGGGTINGATRCKAVIGFPNQQGPEALFHVA
jgi:hypothetical protein